jgi:hypothetical protein
MFPIRVESLDDGGKASWRGITPMNYFEDNIIPHKYICDRQALGDLVRAMKSGNDIVRAASAVLEDKSTLRLNEYACEPTGKIFSHLEKAVFAKNQFEAIVDPSVGTVKRISETQKHVTLLFSGLPIDVTEEVREENEAYQHEICLVAKQCGMKITKETDFSWTKFGPDSKYSKMRVYFSHYGWKMHNFVVNGMGLELNPYVAANQNLSLCDLRDDDLAVYCRYTRNLTSADMIYLKQPNYYRRHGSEYMLSAAGRKRHLDRNNLYNVVSTDFTKTNLNILRTENAAAVMTPGTRFIPAYDRTEFVEHKKNRYVVGFAGDNPITVLEPAFEISSREKAFEDIYGRPPPVGKELSMSNISLLYYIGSEGIIKKKRYHIVTIKHHFGWVSNGHQWHCQVAPGSVALGMYEFRHSDGEQERIYNAAGLWNEFGEVRADYFVHVERGCAHFYIPDVLGEIEYYIADYNYHPVDNCVTILGHTKCPVALNHTGKLIFGLGGVRVYEFESCDVARTFYLANSNFKRCMWMGDVTRVCDIDHPMNGLNKMLDIDGISTFNSVVKKMRLDEYYSIRQTPGVLTQPFVTTFQNFDEIEFDIEGY